MSQNHEYLEARELWARTLHRTHGHVDEDLLHEKAKAHVASQSEARTVQPKLVHTSVDHRKELRWVIGLLALIALLLVPRAHCQFSHINTIAFQHSDNSSASFNAAPFIVKEGSNITFTLGTCPGADCGKTIIAASSTAATAFSAITAATNSNAGTFAASGNTWDFTAAGLLKLRIAAGLTTASNGEIGYDTTNKNWHIWANAVDNFIATVPVSVTVTSGHLVTWSLVSGVLTLNDGGPVPSGGAPCTVTASSVQYNNSGAFGCISTLTTDGTIVTATAGADFVFKDPTTATKHFHFDASNITAANDRVVNIPDANSTTAQAITCTNQVFSVMSAQGVFTCHTVTSSDVDSSIVPSTRTVNGHALSANVTVSAADVGLGNVTNDVQTKAAVMPNTAPSAGQIPVGNAGGTAYVPQSVSGDGTLSSAGALSVNNGSHITNSSIPNSGLVNTGTAVSGATCTLGSTCTITRECSDGLGDGLNAITAGTYLVTNCFNDFGASYTISAIRCFTDNSGTSTLNAANDAGTGLLTGAVTCTNAFAAGTLSGTTTIATSHWINFTFVADGTTKRATFEVTVSR